jgi:hypothetical protein
MHLGKHFRKKENDNASIANMLCDSCILAIDMHFGRPHIALCNEITHLFFVFLMISSECGTT